jgi:acyl phosphate:glycerol-3-phosphate acyltransferase
VVAIAWVAGSIPFSNIAARIRASTDLRAIGSGTVSGTSLYDVAGFGPLALAGICDVAKGSVGPLLAGPDRPALSAISGAAGVAGHDWSPFLRGAGGRGISTAMGALAVHHWPGTAVLAAGLAGGRLARETGFGSFLAGTALVPTLAWRRGRWGALAGATITAVLAAKRMAGNQPPENPGWHPYRHRLLYDCDPGERGKPRVAAAGGRIAGATGPGPSN